MNGKIGLILAAAAFALAPVHGWAAPESAHYDASGDLIIGATQLEKGDSRLKEVADYVSEHVKPWINDPVIVSAVKKQDAESKHLSQVQIDTLDIGFLKRSDHKLIDSKMNNKVSDFLREKKKAVDGIVIEFFIFDDRGLNVAQTDLTADYLQGDEAKYWKSFGVGPDAIVVEKIATDGGFPHIAQASLAIKDPSTGKAIGAMTVGVNYDEMVKAKK